MTASAKLLTAVTFIAGALAATVGVALALATHPTQRALPLYQGTVGSAFTYQGQLTSAGETVNDTCDMEFRLYGAAVDGSQVGATINTSVPITDGLFTLQLDFGGSAFQGDARWLSVMVKCPGDTAFTDLGRQELTAAPYALYALGAPWAGLSGVPGDFEDGVDDDTMYAAGTGLVLTDTTFSADAGYLQRRVSASCTSGSSVRAIGGDGSVACEPHSGQFYYNVVVVAKSGGHFTSVQAALDSIADASATNRYLLWVAPGTYTETVTMKEYVDIEGAGELTTKITYWGSSSPYTGTLAGADNVELRFLTVESTGGDELATAISNNSASPRLTHVTAIASGAHSDNVGVLNNSSSPTMTHVIATARGTALSDHDAGVVNTGNSSPMMRDVIATASGGVADVYGVFNGSGSSPTMLNVIATGSGGADNFGVVNYMDCAPIMTSVTAIGQGGAHSVALWNESSWPTVERSTLRGEGGTTSYGIGNIGSGGPYTMTVNTSRIVGATATIYNDVNVTVLVGGSLLEGGAMDLSSGSVVCAGVWDEQYTFYASSCP